MEGELVSEGPTHRFAGVGNVLVCLYWGSPTAEALRDRIPWVERALERYEALGLVVVITEDATGALPGREFRAESRAQVERFAGKILFSASVIEGDDLQHSLVRTFLRGLAVIVSRELEVKFFDAVPAALAWAAERVADLDGPSADRLAAVLDELRALKDRAGLVG